MNSISELGERSKQAGKYAEFGLSHIAGLQHCKYFALSAMLLFAAWYLSLFVFGPCRQRWILRIL